jgi:competence ComEA-like helix-hairpin-helix protein
MSRFLEPLKMIGKKISNLSSRYFTPSEFRSVLIFIACGVAVVLFRGGKSLFGHVAPSGHSSNTAIMQHQNDSVFAILSRRDRIRDSLQFWMPEDTNRSERYASKLKGKSKKELSLKTEGVALNSSGKDSLQMLPGIGEKMAERIISYRTERGKFRRLHELTNIEGIGEKKFKQIEPYIRLY